MENNNYVGQFVLYIFNLFTAIVGYQVHGSAFWSVVDFFFSPFAWLKWVICHEVSLTVIKAAFAGYM